MPFEIINISSNMIQSQAVEEIEKCNEFTAYYGLTLTRLDAVELAETRAAALKRTGRIEFGGGVIEKIVKEFCDSPYLSTHNYVEMLHELAEIFYLYKNETLDLMSDEDLIKFMKKCFNGSCQGSLELLSERELASMAHNLRYGYPPDYSGDMECEEKGDEDDEY